MQEVQAWVCMDVKVRLYAHVSTRDLNLQLFRRERLCSYFLPFNYKQVSCPEGENIPSQLTAPHPVPKPLSKMPCVPGAWGWKTWELAIPQQAQDLGYR